MTLLRSMVPAVTAATLLASLGTVAVATAAPPGAAPAGAPAGSTTATGRPSPGDRPARRPPRRNVKTTPTYTGKIIVRYVDTHTGTQATDRRQKVLATAGTRTGRTLRTVRSMARGATLVAGATPGTARAVAAQLAAQPGILGAEPDVKLYPLAGPDPGLPDQWSLADSRLGVRATTAWARSAGAGVRVAVLDTGITDHPDLAGQTIGGYDFIADDAYSRDGDGRDADPADPGDWADAGDCGDGDPGNTSSWHGSLVTGVIAAVKDNAAGIAGIAPKARVVPIRVLGKCGGDLSDVADALRWAAGETVPGVPPNPYPAKVLNLSLGAPGTCSLAMQSAVDAAHSLGATVVVAAGNHGSDVSNFFPASCVGVITVGATDASGRRASYSNHGAGISLVAPGGDYEGADETRGILSTANDGDNGPGVHDYYWAEGTSLAAPHVSAIAALILQTTSTLTPDQVRARLTATARTSCTGCGAGLVDAARAIGLPAAPTPVVSSIAPAVGPLRGGNVVAISGVGLTPTTRVTIGGILARVIRVSPTRLWVVVPARRSPSTAGVSVTTPHGTNPTVTRSLYRYVPAPALSGLSRRSGSRKGGTTTTLAGSNLSGATAVYFGTKRASWVRTLSSRRLVVRTPRVQRRGVVYVRVQTVGGLTSRSRAVRFGYR
ncbi:MAG TPA: S8 family serine peptidase [Dermatophilaceae bacterium]|nr:S8 family serine peptidase [Dermatophilaceae bacterium]